MPSQVHNKVSRFLIALSALALPAMIALAAPDTAQIATGIESLDSQIIATQEQRTLVQTKIEELNQQLADAEANHSGVQNDLNQHARRLYRISRAGMLPITEGFDVMLQYSSRLQRYSRLIGRLLAQQKSERGYESQLHNAIAMAEEETRTLDNHVADLQDQRADFLSAEQEARESRAFVQPLGAEPKLVRDVDASDTSNSGLIDATADSLGFQSRKGQLALPVHGTLQMRDATRAGSRGVEFITDAGKEVHCASAGRVAFIRYPTGNVATVVIEHGDGFYTLYSGVGQVDVQQGDWMGEGARIGRVAPGNPASIFFEVRRSDKNLNARDWLGF